MVTEPVSNYIAGTGVNLYGSVQDGLWAMTKTYHWIPKWQAKRLSLMIWHANIYTDCPLSLADASRSGGGASFRGSPGHIQSPLYLSSRTVHASLASQTSCSGTTCLQDDKLSPTVHHYLADNQHIRQYILDALTDLLPQIQTGDQLSRSAICGLKGLTLHATSCGMTSIGYLPFFNASLSPSSPQAWAEAGMRLSTSCRLSSSETEGSLQSNDAA